MRVRWRRGSQQRKRRKEGGRGKKERVSGSLDAVLNIHVIRMENKRQSLDELHVQYVYM